MSWEVWIMKSKTSFCDAQMLKRHFTRFLPVWVLLAVFILLQFSYANLTSPYSGDETPRSALASEICHELPILTLLLAIVIAGCIFSYLHKARSCMMLHALPIRRQAIYRSGVFAGFAVFALPWTVALLLLLQSVSFVFLMKSWLFGMVLYLLFYGLAVWSMIFCGKTIAAVCVYMAINVMLPVMEAEIKAVLSPMLYGVELNGAYMADYASVEALSDNAIWITSNGIDDIEFNALYISVMAVIGIVLLVCGELMYRKRKMETVGSVIAYPKAMPIVLYIATFCIALVFGNGLYEMTFELEPAKESAWILLLLILICGLAGFVVMQMLLKMSMRVFKAKAFLGYGIFSAVMIIVFSLFYFDCFGIVSYVPTAQEIVSVSVSSPPQAKVILSDDEDISEICKIHERLLSVREKDFFSPKVNIDYELDGEVVHRSYYVPSEGAEQIIDDLKKVVDTEKNVQEFFDRLQQEADQKFYVNIFNGTNENKVIFHPEKLFAAIEQDILEGNMSLVWNEQGCCEIYWYDEQMGHCSYLIPHTAIHTVEYILQIPIE